MLMLEMNMIEQKIALLEATTTVTNVPENESLKTKAIPKQTTLGLDQKPVLLHPKIQKIKEEHRDQRFKIPEDKDQDIFKPPMKFEEFRLIWNKQEQLV
nr:hypothetical protein [Tanacetum cinerariifolium]